VTGIRRDWPVAVLVLGGALLLSMGGAVVAAPVTVPILLWAARHRFRGPLRCVAAGIAALTAAELTWALVYVAVGESKPAIWLLPLAAAGATGAAGLWPAPDRSMAVSTSAGAGRAKR
jgi:hypothetical protein